MSLLTTPFPTENLYYNKGATDSGIIQLFNFRTQQLIKSGEFFELKTNDAIERPLPSFQLLEMQRLLQCVTGMASAVVPYEEDWLDEDSYEEICNLGLDEVKNPSFAFTSPSLPASP